MRLKMWRTDILPQYLTKQKAEGAQKAMNLIHCPSCRQPFYARAFEQHVYTTHGANADKVFAMLYGLEYPVKCSCGRELRYSETHKGFPVKCGHCTGAKGDTQYATAEDALKEAQELEERAAAAREAAKQIAAARDLSNLPLQQMPFPTKKDPRLLRRISMDMRTYAVNGDKDRLIDLANYVDLLLSRL